MKTNTLARNIEAAEAQFHDQWARETQLDEVNSDAYMNSCAAPENRQILSWMGDIRGKKILDLGAGLGEASLFFAAQGAEVTASDISPGMLDLISKNAQKKGLKIKTVECSANDLSVLADQSFDFIYAANLLHHVEISSCVQEVHKKLRIGGQALFWDPIDYNPAINLYRKIATKVRTVDEHPLKNADFKTIKNTFGQAEFRFFWLTGLFIFFKYYFIDRLNPNEIRYWKRVIDDSQKISWWLGPLLRLDSLIFRVFPFMKYFAWNVAVRGIRTKP